MSRLGGGQSVSQGGSERVRRPQPGGPLLPLILALALVGGGGVFQDLTGRLARHPLAPTPRPAPAPVRLSSLVTDMAAPGPPQSATDLPKSGRAERPVVAPTSFAGRRAPAVPPPRALGLAGPKEPGVWAVIVGIDDYPGDDHDLHKAAADARAADAALAAYGVPRSRRIVLLDGQASAANIRGALNWMVGHAAPEATAVVFFAGHARHILAGRRGGPTHASFIGADGVDLLDTEVARALAFLEARSAWIAVATCYGADFDEVLAPGRVLTAAAGRDEVAYENDGLAHSYLVEYMVQRAMIDGRAPASVQDSFTWASASIARDYPNRQPVMIDHSSGPVVLDQQGARWAAVTRPVPQPDQPPPPPEAEPTAPPSPQPDSPALPPGGSQPPCPGVLGVDFCRSSAWSGAPGLSR